MRTFSVLILVAIGTCQWSGLATPSTQAGATAPLPLETVDAQTAAKIQAMRDRRVESITSSILLEDSYLFAHPNNISAWCGSAVLLIDMFTYISDRLATLDSQGRWPDSE